MGFAYQDELDRVRAEERAAAEKQLAAERARNDKRAKLARDINAKLKADLAEARVAVAAGKKATEKLAVAEQRLELEKSKGAGLPPDFHPQLVEELCEKLEAGYPPKQCCAVVGISLQKFNTWRALAQAPNARAELVEFNARVGKVIAQAQLDAWDSVKKACEPKFGEETRADGSSRDIVLQRGDPKTLLELARVLNPEWSPRTIVPIEEPKEAEVNLYEGLTDEEFRIKREAEAIDERQRAKANAAALLATMGAPKALPTLDTQGTPVLESGDD